MNEPEIKHIVFGATSSQLESDVSWLIERPIYRFQPATRANPYRSPAKERVFNFLERWLHRLFSQDYGP